MQGPVQRVHLALARTLGTGATPHSQGHHLVVSAAGARPPDWGTSCGLEPGASRSSTAQVYYHLLFSSGSPRVTDTQCTARRVPG